MLVWADRALGCGPRNVTLSKKAAEAIRKYSWPGNIVELNFTIGDAVVYGTSDIQPDDLKLTTALTSRSAKVEAARQALGRRMAALGVTVDWVAGGNIDKAAALFGVSAETFVVDGAELLLKYRQEKKTREIEALARAWDEEGGNVAAMARRLSLSRQTVESRLKKYELFKYGK